MTKTVPMKTLTISLSSRQVDRLQAAVETGDYASSSEVVRDALRLWERRETQHTLETGQLKQAYTVGMASGEGCRIDRPALLADLKAERRRG